MALSEKDIDALAERILHGAEERYVAELTEAIERNLAELARRGWTAAALEQLALMVPAAAAQILAEHQDAIGDEVAAEVSTALEASSAADDSVLMAVYGATAASQAASWFPTGASSHFKEMALQTARGLAAIIRRQNVILSESAARRWYEVAGEAVTAANLGLKPYDKLLAEATVKLADAGIAAVEYGQGGARTVTNMVDVAVRRHIVTQVSQASGRMAIDRMRAYGHRLVVTSAHYGARPSHAEWQGLPCAIDGEAIVDGVRYPDIVELTGYGTVGGLKGANCRHSVNPYFPGITELPARTWPEHEEKFGCSSEAYYEATQRQRELERRIRKTKREIASLEGNGFGLEDPTYVQKRLLLGNQQRTLAKWCDERNLVRQYAREKAYGVTRQPRALRAQRPIVIGRSAGAAAFRDTVLLPDGSKTKISEGSRITGIVTIAGKGSKRKIDKIEQLVEAYGGKRDLWQKKRGTGYVDDLGMRRKCELHWFEEDDVGRVEMKVKRYYY